MRKPCVSTTIEDAPDIEEIDGRVYWRAANLPIQHYNMSMATAIETYERLKGVVECFQRRQGAQIAKLTERGPMFLVERHD